MIRKITTKSAAIATLGIDIGKNTFHLIGLDKRGAIVLRERLSRAQVQVRLANLTPCLVGLEACVGAHHLGRRLKSLGHDVRLMAAKCVRPFCRKQKNDFNDAEAIAEAVTRPTTRYVALKTPEQLDLQALHRVRERLMSHRTGVINQIRAFLLERGIAIRQGWRALRAELPRALAMADKLTPRMVHLVEDLASDWRQLDARIEAVSIEIEELAHADEAAVRLMSVPGIGPIISSATVAGIGKGDVFTKGRDFGAWLGIVPKTNLDRRKTDIGPHLQTRKPLSATSCTCRPLASCCSGRKTGSFTASSTGSRLRPAACTITSSPSRLPTSLPASPGAFCILGALLKREG